MTLEHRAADAVVWLLIVAALLLGGTCLRGEPTPILDPVPSRTP